MTAKPVTVQPDLPALSALDLMIDQGIRHLPVVNRRERLCGILSLDDLRAALPFAVSLARPPGVEDRRSALDYSIGELMTHGPITAREETPVAEAASLLARFHIGALPVVDASGKVVGIFSETDALHALAGSPTPRREPPSARALDLELLVAELRAEKARIAKQLEQVQDAERELSAAIHDVPTDREEHARDLTQIAVDEPLAALAAQRLAGIDHALARAGRGQLGSCERCRREIPTARLRALPGTALCIRCASASAPESAPGASR